MKSSSFFSSATSATLVSRFTRSDLRKLPLGFWHVATTRVPRASVSLVLVGETPRLGLGQVWVQRHEQRDGHRS